MSRTWSSGIEDRRVDEAGKLGVTAHVFTDR
jgi:hypothetical protein